MTVASLERAPSAAAPPADPVRRPAPRPRTWAADAGAVVAGLGLGATVGLGITSESWGALRAPGGWFTFAGQMTALVGSYLMLVLVLLMGRIPAVERVVGQDRLSRWHRTLGPWPIYLIGAHAVLVTLGYAEQARTGFGHQLWMLLRSYPDVLMATVAFGLIVLAGVTSIRRARARMRYETWWTVHLYLYLAMALAFPHQLADGQSFVGHPLTIALWSALWAGTAGVVICFRLLLPMARSLRHSLRVVSVTDEGPGVVSIVCRGRRLDRLAVAGGQFFRWRFLTSGLCWQAHPYSLSALPRPPYLRVTVKGLGDQSAAVAALRPGTRVAIEGPYGAFTQHARRGDKVLLVGAGVGVTPVRALLEDLPAHVEADVILRAGGPDEVFLGHEVEALVKARGGRFTPLVGSRREVRLDPARLIRLVPDLAERDVYVCGPGGFMELIVDLARRGGVAEDRIHREEFEF